MVEYRKSENPTLSISDYGELGSDYIAEYWNFVHKTFVDVFGMNVLDANSAINTLQDRLESAPDKSKLLFFHLEPLQVVADYIDAQRPLSTKITSKYNSIRQNINTLG